MIAWVKTLTYAESSGVLRQVYDKIRGARPEPHNLYRAHSLRPHTMLAADYLYKTVLHWPDNTLPKWLAELISTYTAHLCQCDYAVSNHGANFRQFYGDEEAAEKIWVAVCGDQAHTVLDAKPVAMLHYTRKLTLTPGTVNADDILAMRNAGADDGEVVEVNQLCSSFNYYARVLNGLGVELDPGPVGLTDLDRVRTSNTEDPI